MGVVIDIRKNPVLMRWEKEWSVSGRAAMLTDLLRTKFGPLPKWASERVQQATPAQLTRWGRKILTAATLEAVVGPKSAAR